MRYRAVLIIAALVLIWTWSAHTAHAATRHANAYHAVPWQHKTRRCNTVSVWQWRTGTLGHPMWRLQVHARACRRHGRWMRRHIKLWYQVWDGAFWSWQGVEERRFHRTKTYVYWYWRGRFDGFTGTPSYINDRPSGWIKIGKRHLRVVGETHCGC